VVCSFNGASTIRDTLNGLRKLDYPDFEVIVVDDGSTDSTPQIISEYRVRLISTENRVSVRRVMPAYKQPLEKWSLSSTMTRYPDIHWLKFLAGCIIDGNYVGVGDRIFRHE